ncbi:MAG: exodeoxyribonuclease V subunit alpha [Ilumatobacteraceae bacterium]
MTSPSPSSALAAVGRRAVRLTSIPPALMSLAPWVDAGVFGTAEVHGAEVLSRAAAVSDPLMQLAAAIALWAPLHGHTCVDLDRVAAMVTSELAVALTSETTETTGSPATTVTADAGHVSDSADGVLAVASSLPWPALNTWIDELRSSTLVRCVDHIDAALVLDDRPLVLHGTLLYTQRQWTDECLVAEHLLRRARTSQAHTGPLAAPAEALLDRLLPPLDDVDGAPNLQHQAARAAISSRLAIIVGGPGTGKTHTIARTLAVLSLDATERRQPLRVGLAAPTGKAAARLGEAIASAISEGLPAGSLSAETSTIHRMLGWRGSTTRFRHDADTPLPYDIVVIDEASMVALPLMARLLEAIRPDARLIIVGDPDQLHSIEVGAVLADTVAAAADPTSLLHPLVVRLQRSRRLQHLSPIAPLADAVRDNEPSLALSQLRNGSDDPDDPDDGGPLLTFIDSLDPLATNDGSGVRGVILPALVAAADAARAGEAAKALAHFATVRVLCAHRTGRHGAEYWNRAIEAWLLETVNGPGRGRPPRFYPGRALLATRNDQRQGVANGDTGIVISDPDGVRAAFGTADGLRVLAPAQLERVATAFATTIHKSQGSEFDTVVVILPPPGSPLAGRELLYTAITRASRRLVVVGTPASIVVCITTPSRRVTGLAAALASASAGRSTD